MVQYDGFVSVPEIILFSQRKHSILEQFTKQCHTLLRLHYYTEYNSLPKLFTVKKTIVLQE